MVKCSRITVHSLLLPFLEHKDVNLVSSVQLSMPNSKCQNKSNKVIVHRTHLFVKIDSESYLRLYLSRRSAPSLQKAYKICKGILISETYRPIKHTNNLALLSIIKRGQRWLKLQLLKLAVTKSTMFKKSFSRNFK